MRPLSAVTCSLLLLVGCAPGNFSTTAVLPTTTPGPTPTSAPNPTPLAPTLPGPIASTSATRNYHAYGDSITFGYELPNPAKQAYSVLVGLAEGFTTTNDGVTGDLACDTYGIRMAPTGDNPSATASLHYSMLLGTNDLDTYGAGAHEGDYSLCMEASASWLAVPREFKLLATDAAVSGSGTGSLVTQDGFTSWTTNADGASVSFPFTLAAAGPMYIWYRVASGVPGTFAYALDGAALGTINRGTALPLVSNHGFSTALALFRLANVSAGMHTLTFTQTTGVGGGGLGIVAIGAVPPAGQAGLSRVLLGTIPRQEVGSAAICALNAAVCAAYTADVTNVVSFLAHDGLNVALFDSRKYTSGTAADMADSIHPNALGDQEIAHAVEDAVP